MSQKGYSKYIRPISYLIDFLLIVWLLLFIYPSITLGVKSAILLLIIWTLIANFTEFYEVFRFTAPSSIISKTLKQLALFSLIFIALIFALERVVLPILVLKYTISLLTSVTFFKFLIYYSLKKYRTLIGRNYRNVVIIGSSEEASNLSTFFNKNEEYGYKLISQFSPNTSISTIKDFILENAIDELYCDLNSIDKETINTFITFSYQNFKSVKLIPDNSVLSHNMVLDYYGFIPVISIRKTPLELLSNYWLKRIFDIFFSLFIIIFVLSWLLPIIAIFIKIESKGPIFFKQGRPGLNQDEFYCFKFRSMKINNKTEEMMTKNDPRVTKVGAFLRRTSLDELPQFFNVLFGDMSVVGPRPHLWSHNNEYQQKIEKYNIRLQVKPGITGLAQVRGYRGEIETDEEMINRIKLDVFYIENWSLYLDVKIILLTVINIFKGQEKAY